MLPGYGGSQFCFGLTVIPPVARFEENQSGTAEMEEFLPQGAEKKQTHFTDVSIGMGTMVVRWGSPQCDSYVPSLFCLLCAV